MDSMQIDLNRALMLDGNAVAGMLAEIFSAEMTTNLVECAHCGSDGAMGTLLVFGQAPGLVLRCPACENIVMRIVQAPGAFYLEMRGMAYMRMERAIA